MPFDDVNSAGALAMWPAACQGWGRRPAARRTLPAGSGTGRSLDITWRTQVTAGAGCEKAPPGPPEGSMVKCPFCALEPLTGASHPWGGQGGWGLSLSLGKVTSSVRGGGVGGLGMGEPLGSPGFKPGWTARFCTLALGVSPENGDNMARERPQARSPLSQEAPCPAVPQGCSPPAGAGKQAGRGWGSPKAHSFSPQSGRAGDTRPPGGE